MTDDRTASRQRSAIGCLTSLSDGTRGCRLAFGCRSRDHSRAYRRRKRARFSRRHGTGLGIRRRCLGRRFRTSRRTRSSHSSAPLFSPLPPPPYPSLSLPRATRSLRSRCRGVQKVHDDTRTNPRLSRGAGRGGTGRGEARRDETRRGDSQRCLPYPEVPSFPRSPPGARVLVYPRWRARSPAPARANDPRDATLLARCSRLDAPPRTRRCALESAGARMDGRMDGQAEQKEKKARTGRNAKARPRRCVTRRGAHSCRA